MVQLPLDILQWLSVVLLVEVEDRKCKFERAQNKIYLTLFSSVVTELWELDSFERQTINPTLSGYYAPGLFLVDIGYCSKNSEENKVTEQKTIRIG